MRRIILLLTLLANSAFAGDDIIIQLVKYDAARHTTEQNHLQINEGHIYYRYDKDKGEARPLLPGEFEVIINAMKSQVSYIVFDNNAKPKDIPYYHFSLEYDVGAKTIEYDVKGVTIENELSPDMKNLLRKYFNFKFN
jgi:hypothetical protein